MQLVYKVLQVLPVLRAILVRKAQQALTVLQELLALLVPRVLAWRVLQVPQVPLAQGAELLVLPAIQVLKVLLAQQVQRVLWAHKALLVLLGP